MHGCCGLFLRQITTVIWREKINLGANRHHPRGVDRRMAAIIMVLDMIQANSFRYAGLLIQVPNVAPKVWIIDNPPDVTFEMPYIYRIKPDHRGEQTPISLGDGIAG